MKSQPRQTPENAVKQRIRTGSELAVAMTPEQDKRLHEAFTRVRMGETGYFHEFAELLIESDAREERIRELELQQLRDSECINRLQTRGYEIEAENAKLREALVEIGEYKGEGGPATPWQDIVRNLGEIAREAIAGGKEG